MLEAGIRLPGWIGSAPHHHTNSGSTNVCQCVRMLICLDHDDTLPLLS